MKFLYVLVSNSADYYSEQCYMSVYSLKKNTPDAFVSLLVDTETHEHLQKDFPLLLESVHEVKTVKLDSATNKEKSRILKTSMRKHIDDDFLFIDCDTVICEDLSEIENCCYDIGCVLDSHVPVCEHWGKDWMKKNCKKCGFEESITKEIHFNSGVIYCKDNANTRNFFNDWARLMKQSVASGVYIDQPAFNQADTLNGNLIKELHGKWNCQLVQGGVRYLSDAKIIHYFASQRNFRSPYLLADKKVLQHIKDFKKLSAECVAVLDNPKQAIDETTALLSPDVPIEILFHQPFQELVYFYKSHNIIYNLLRLICFFVGKVHR